jgi:hypothetical protein
MKLQIVPQPDTLDGYFVFVPRNFIHIWAGALIELSERWVWASDEDYELAYRTIALLRGCMLDCPAQQLIEGNKQLYRLLSSAFFGTTWSVVSTEPLVIEPPIPDVPDMLMQLPGNLAQLDDARTKLQTIIDTMSADDEDIAGILQQLIEIGALLA